MFTDSHSHIQVAQEFPNVEETIARAEKAGVTTQIVIGCTIEDSREAVAFVKKHADKNFYEKLLQFTTTQTH